MLHFNFANNMGYSIETFLVLYYVLYDKEHLNSSFPQISD